MKLGMGWKWVFGTNANILETRCLSGGNLPFWAIDPPLGSIEIQDFFNFDTQICFKDVRNQNLGCKFQDLHGWLEEKCAYFYLTTFAVNV